MQSLVTSIKNDLLDQLLNSIDQQFGGSGKSLEEQEELFFKEVHPVHFVIAFRQGWAEKLLRDVSSELRSYLLDSMEKIRKKAKEELQVNE